MTVPSWATCLMSALESAEPLPTAEGDRRTFSWKQSVPMPSYLIAIAVGELESREISARYSSRTPKILCFPVRRAAASPRGLVFSFSFLF